MLLKYMGLHLSPMLPDRTYYFLSLIIFLLTQTFMWKVCVNYTENLPLVASLVSIFPTWKFTKYFRAESFTGSFIQLFSTNCPCRLPYQAQPSLQTQGSQAENCLPVCSCHARHCRLSRLLHRGFSWKCRSHSLP